MKTVFFDVDTQVDFLLPAGALFVPGAGDIWSKLAALTKFASSNDIQILSTADAHSEDDPEFKIWKPHCVVDTTGQQKVSVTSLSHPLVVTTDPGAVDGIAELATKAKQIVVEKQKLDCFTNPNLATLLDLIRADRYVVYGVVTELCVQCAVSGLLKTGARTELVMDAIKSLDSEAERQMIKQFQEQGGALTTTDALVNG